MTDDELVKIVEIVIWSSIKKGILEIDDNLSTRNDLKNELFIAARKALRLYNPQKSNNSNCKAYLMQRLNYEVLDYKKRLYAYHYNIRIKKHDILQDMQLIWSITDERKEPMSNNYDIDYEWLYVDLEAILTEKQFFVITEYYLKGRTFQEIGEADLNATHSAASEINRRAIKNMRNFYKLNELPKHLINENLKVRFEWKSVS